MDKPRPSDDQIRNYVRTQFPHLSEGFVTEFVQTLIANYDNENSRGNSSAKEFMQTVQNYYDEINGKSKDELIAELMDERRRAFIIGLLFIFIVAVLAVVIMALIAIM
jgi:uncharacterized membrane protein